MRRNKETTVSAQARIIGSGIAIAPLVLHVAHHGTKTFTSTLFLSCGSRSLLLSAQTGRLCE